MMYAIFCAGCLAGMILVLLFASGARRIGK